MQATKSTRQFGEGSAKRKLGPVQHFARKIAALLPADHDLVKPCEGSRSSMSRQVYLAEIEDVLGSREKRGVAGDSGLTECFAELNAEAEGEAETGEGANGGGRYFTPPVSANLVGLALSGGGIRSATFCLGVLQVMGERGVLRFADYLSTVSGGGYIGSFWSCFLARSKIDGVNLADFEEDGVRPFQTNPLYKLSHRVGREESETFQRLRNFANYLLLGGLWNALRGPALVIRGLVVNFLMILPYVLVLSALVAWIFRSPINGNAFGWTILSGLPSPLWPWVLGIALFLSIVVSTLLQSLYRRGGRTNAAWRERLFGVVMLMAVVALAVIWIDLQPKLLFALYCTSGNLGCNRLNLSFLYSNEFWSAVSVALGTVLAVLAGVVSARASNLKGKLILAAVGILGPLSFLLLHFLLTAWAVLGLPDSIWLPAWAVDYVLTPRGYLLVGLALALVARFFDVNATSLHNFYRDSLSRTFLFSLRETKSQATTVREDDIRLGEIDIKASGGPYHLMNATVNNPNLEDMALRGRRSDFFVFGARYSGNNRLGYCPTKVIENVDSSANLGMALAVSAAALAPNMGEKTRPILTFLLAMLNLRLGYWLPSPETAVSAGKYSSNMVGPAYFFAEMLNLGSKRKAQRYVNLSDGGHIENLGIFELLRRRCRYIIAVDSEADPDLTFNGLATLIRLARTDMGVDIDIECENLRKDGQGLSRRHWALGRIDYGEEQRGVLLYIKSSVTGTENEYISEYRSRKPHFPHETTSDQFFDEEQFEAYRALGYKVGRSVFPSDSDPESTPAKVFAELRERDNDGAGYYDIYFELLDRRRTVDHLLVDPDLESYMRELVPESESGERPKPESADTAPVPPSSKLHQVCNAQLQFMERAVLALRLDDPRCRNRSSNSGWMSLFMRWGRSPTFQKLWLANIPTYSSVLQTFCHDALDLGLGVAWHPEKGARGKQGDKKGSAVQRFVAELSDIHRGGGTNARLNVASATIERGDGQAVLTEFETVAPYSSRGLRELLCRTLEEQHEVSTYRLKSGAPDYELTIDALRRCYFRPSA